MYFLTTQNTEYTASEIRNKVGLNPTEITNLGMLNRTGVYPVSSSSDLHDYDDRLYTSNVSYVINGNYATRTFTTSDRPLSEAKDAAYVAVKEKYETELETAIGDWGIFTLVAIAAKTSTTKTDEETQVINDITTISNNLAADIDAIEAATSVADIELILN